MISRIIGGVVSILIAVSLFPVISDELAKVQTDSVGFAPTMLKLVPYCFLFIVVSIGIATAYGGLQDSGAFGYSEEYREDYEAEPEKPHKQTYEEYVAERLRVERMMKWGPVLGRILP